MSFSNRLLFSIGAFRRAAARLRHAKSGSPRARLRDGYLLALVDLVVLGVATIAGGGASVLPRNGLAVTGVAVLAAGVIRLWPLL